MNLYPIGFVNALVSEPTDENWGNVLSEIQVLDNLAPGLQGLEQFSHIIVIFFMHQSTYNPASDLVRRPQGRCDMPEIGIFAQRAKHQIKN